MASIQQQELQLSAVTDSLTILSKFMERLEAKQVAISESIRYKQCYLSSVRRLPIEILQEIFLYCIPEYRVEICGPQRNLWNIGQVCTLWRGALLSLHNLWRRLYIDLNLDTRMKMWADTGAALSVLNQRIHACLARGGELPISINFVPGSTAWSWCTLASLLDTLGEYSSQWGDFSAALDSWNVRHIEVLFQRKVEVLKSVHIEGHNYEGRVLGFFFSTPQLSSLSLASVRHPLRTIFPITPSAQITRFVSKENMFLAGEVLEILKLLPNLAHFESSQDYGIEEAPFGDTEEVELLHLSCLKLTARTLASFALLDCLVTPLLSHISIDLHASKGGEVNALYAQATAAFVRRASGSLRCISIGNIPEYFVEELILGIDTCRTIEVYGSQELSGSLQTLFRRRQMKVVESIYSE